MITLYQILKGYIVTKLNLITSIQFTIKNITNSTNQT